MIKFKGKIIAALAPKGGVSKNGNQWQSQEFVLEIPGQYPKRVAFQMMNDKLQQFPLSVGQEVEVSLDINANEWNGRWFNQLTAWKVEYTQQAAPQPAQPAGYAAAPPQPAYQQPARQPAASADDKDDLPF